MSFRFLQFATLYPEFERQFLTANPDYSTLSYQELYDRLVNMHFSLADVYVRQMRVRGNEAEYHCVSLEPLQKAWAREHSIRYQERTWLRDIALAQTKAFHPDVIFLQDTFLFDQAFRKQLRVASQRPIILTGWRAAPTSDFSVFSDLDAVFTAGPHFVDEFRKQGAAAFLLPLAFDKSVLDNMPTMPERDLAFTFVGTVGTPNGPHADRYAFIEQLLRSASLEVWGEESVERKYWRRTAHKAVFHINQSLDFFGVSREARGALPIIGRGAAWQRDPVQPSLRSRFPDQMHSPVFGLEAYKIMNRSKLTFNCHIGAAGKYAGNNRLYEATGVGSCLVTDWKEDIEHYFKPDVEVVTYQSVAECIDKVQYLLEHEIEREAIATAGQRRTLADHTFANRTQQMIDVIDSILTEKNFANF